MGCGSRRWNALRTFVEAFQGEVKDGTNGTRDLRKFSALFFILRILILFSHLQHQYWNSWPLLWTQIMLGVITSCLITITRPYKENYRNIVDCLILAVLLLLFLVLNLVLYSRHTTSDFTIAMILVGTPHAVLLSYICYKLAEKAGIVQCLKAKYHVLKGLAVVVRHASHEADVEGGPDINAFPDRLQNPEKYEPDAQNTPPLNPVKGQLPESQED